MLTTYRIVFQLANRVKEIEINAATPLQALHKFKDMTPKIVFNNLSINEIKIDMEHKPYIKKNEPKLCCPCNLIFDKLLKAI